MAQTATIEAKETEHTCDVGQEIVIRGGIVVRRILHNRFAVVRPADITVRVDDTQK